jgi:hypothetical protein
MWQWRARRVYYIPSATLMAELPGATPKEKKTEEDGGCGL